jgi:RimJ/RimL family protein N-acetyltransferase
VLEVWAQLRGAQPHVSDDLARPFHTERLTLRRLHAADLETFAAYRADDVLARYQGWSPMTRDAARAFLEQMHAAPAFVVGQWFQWGIADRHSDVLRGDLGIHLRDGDTAEVGFTLARSAHGRGLGREAVAALLEVLFARTTVTRVIGVTDARNTPSARLMASVGMQHVHSEPTTFRGEPCVEWTFERRRS